MSATATVLAWVLLGLNPDGLDRIRGALGVGAEVSVEELAAHRGLDLALLVRVLTPDEWRQAMRRLGGSELKRPAAGPAEPRRPA